VDATSNNPMDAREARRVLWAALHAMYTRGALGMVFAVVVGRDGDPIAEAWGACADARVLEDVAHQAFDYDSQCEPASDHATRVRNAWRDFAPDDRARRVCAAFRSKLPPLTLAALARVRWDAMPEEERYADPEPTDDRDASDGFDLTTEDLDHAG
jgi:hypothetical protein